MLVKIVARLGIVTELCRIASSYDGGEPEFCCSIEVVVTGGCG